MEEGKKTKTVKQFCLDSAFPLSLCPCFKEKSNWKLEKLIMKEQCYPNMCAYALKNNVERLSLILIKRLPYKYGSTCF